MIHTNLYFQKIRSIIKNVTNRIKANSLKRKILDNNIDLKCACGLEDNPIDTAVIAIILEDASVVEKLYKDKSLLYYVSLLEEDIQLAWLNKHLDIFAEDKNSVYEMALNNISIEKLLTTELGNRIIDVFPLECYKKVETLDNDKLQEINSQGTTNISLTGFANKLLLKEDGDLDYIKVLDFLNSDISIKNKIAILKIHKVKLMNFQFSKTKNIMEYNILNLNISDADKIEIINNLDIHLCIEDWENCAHISDELRNCLINRTSERDFKSYINKTFPVEYQELTYYKLKNIFKIVSIFGEERIIAVLSPEQKQNYSLCVKLANNFDEDHIKALLPGYYYKRDFLEMNFLEKSRIGEIKYFLVNINQDEEGLAQFKKYYDFRDKNNNLDFCESLYQSLYEYAKYGNLYNEIVENFQKLSDEEKIEFRHRWNDLMSLDNKFGIQSIQDFKRMDEIEKEYYTNILEQASGIGEIKSAISEILVRNGRIENITKLGNGTDYSMKNKSLEDVIDLLSTINEITDQEALRAILKDCIEIIGSEELKRFRSIGRNIEEKIVQEYREGYTDSFTKYDEMSDEELAKIEGIKVQRINGVRIIELMGAKFSFLAHVGDIEGGHVRCCCSQITDDNYSFFSGAKNARVFSNFSPNRIKFVNLGDAGCSKYMNTYISSKDLPFIKEHTGLGSHNELTLNTGKEKGDDGLKSTSIITKGKVGSEDFNNALNAILRQKTMRKTVYVIHTDVYERQNQQQALEQEKNLRNYLKKLDSKFLNLILHSATRDRIGLDLLLEEIKKNITIHMDNKIGKSTLRRNITRYWQLSRRRDGKVKLPYDIMTELQKELERMDNELLVGKNITDKIKEITDGWEKDGR